jgi:hypothetical protein
MNIHLNISAQHMSAEPDWRIVAGSKGMAHFTAAFSSEWDWQTTSITWRNGAVVSHSAAPPPGMFDGIPDDVLIPGYLRIIAEGTSPAGEALRAESGPIHVAKAGAIEGDAPGIFTG